MSTTIWKNKTISCFFSTTLIIFPQITFYKGLLILLHFIKNQVNIKKKDT